MIRVRKEEVISYLEDAISHNTYTDEEYSLYCDYKLFGDTILTDELHYAITRKIVNILNEKY